MYRYIFLQESYITISWFEGSNFSNALTDLLYNIMLVYYFTKSALVHTLLIIHFFPTYIVGILLPDQFSMNLGFFQCRIYHKTD